MIQTKQLIQLDDLGHTENHFSNKNSASSKMKNPSKPESSDSKTLASDPRAFSSLEGKMLFLWMGFPIFKHLTRHFFVWLLDWKNTLVAFFGLNHVYGTFGCYEGKCFQIIRKDRGLNLNPTYQPFSETWLGTSNFHRAVYGMIHPGKPNLIELGMF